ncbi:hypothetical protein PTSG_09605 [Salpingoeca rosetta]|uniref:EF-hand domain-containing protein n=1 Tax=Salpingoeca rosetta (strain ATCC 50818 / BSB-021) TaxID=946362 RepID=F2ULH3_SALR5|nr:uncharacterized protein PTSG_09605 [Salpingoeca rosetta]EGD77972.1 hypothetical protein PTSG_09605 [Salpingoeca rosetta]|eukprot:XP_004990034.1 hypothetical protein PTSG_09605 [Salpingoeca rosetta]
MPAHHDNGSTERAPLLGSDPQRHDEEHPTFAGRQHRHGRMLTSDTDDVHSFHLMLLRATVFVEDACALRPMAHRQDTKALNLRRWYFSRGVQAVLLLITLVNATLVFYENPQAFFSPSTLRRRDIVPTAIEVVSLLVLGVDAYLRYSMTGWMFYKMQPLELVYAGATTAGLIGCVLNMAIAAAPAWHRLLRPVYLSIRWPDMTLIATTLAWSLRDVVPHIVLLTILNAAAALMAMIIFPSDPNFSTFSDALEALLVFTSGSNSPDVMLPSLNQTSLSVIFFFALSILSTVLILGIVLATIYNRSVVYMNQVSRHRFAQRRTAFRLAFLCLDRVSQNVASGLIDFATMRALLKSVWHVDDRLIGVLLSLLDKNNTGTINVHEFTYMFELMLLKVERVRPTRTWVRTHLPWLYRMCDLGWLAATADAVLVVNLIVLAVDLTASPPEKAVVCAPYCGVYLACAIVYLLELLITTTALGWRRILRNPLALVDMLLVVAIFIGQVDAFNGTSQLIPLAFARALLICRIMRLGRMLARVALFRLMFTSVARVLSQLPGLLGVLLATYYIFALLGIALFKDRLGFNPALANSTYAEGGLQVFNFDTFGQACISLWVVQLQLEIQDLIDACMQVTSPWSVLYFMAWLLVSYLLILNVFFAFLIDSVDVLINRPKRKEYFRVTAAGVRKIQEDEASTHAAVRDDSDDDEDDDDDEEGDDGISSGGGRGGRGGVDSRADGRGSSRGGGHSDVTTASPVAPWQRPQHVQATTPERRAVLRGTAEGAEYRRSTSQETVMATTTPIDNSDKHDAGPPWRPQIRSSAAVRQRRAATRSEDSTDADAPGAMHPQSGLEEEVVEGDALSEDEDALDVFEIEQEVDEPPPTTEPTPAAVVMMTNTGRVRTRRLARPERRTSTVVYGVEYRPGYDTIIGADGDTSSQDNDDEQDLDLEAVARMFGWHLQDGSHHVDETAATQGMRTTTTHAPADDVDAAVAMEEAALDEHVVLLDASGTAERVLQAL